MTRLVLWSPTHQSAGPVPDGPTDRWPPPGDQGHGPPPPLRDERSGILAVTTEHSDYRQASREQISELRHRPSQNGMTWQPTRFYRPVYECDLSEVYGGQCRWEATRGKRTRVPGTAMGGQVEPGDLPHDLAQFVAEASLGLQYGFWGLVAQGANFKSTGRKVTRRGRHVIVEHRADLMAAEHAVNAEVTSWRLGGAGPASLELTRSTSTAGSLTVNTTVPVGRIASRGCGDARVAAPSEYSVAPFCADGQCRGASTQLGLNAWTRRSGRHRAAD